MSSMISVSPTPVRASKDRNGFTLIEMMVVISLMVMLMLTATSLFFTTLIGTGKTNSNYQVKEEGDYVLGQMTYLLRNAIQMRPNLAGDTCLPGMDSISFLSYDNGISTLSLQPDAGDGNHEKIASESATNGQFFMSSSRVEVVSGPTFNCSQNSDGTGVFIEIDFELRKGTPGLDEPRDIVQERFSSGVAVRSLY